jgi:putative transposase
VIVFIGEHRSRFGVEPIWRVLNEHGCKIAPRTYYANKAGPACARAVRDQRLLVAIRQVHQASRGGLYGARKVHAALLREGVVVARCTVERLMRTDGLQGVSRGKRVVRTTIADKNVARPADLVKRDFTATAPNRLWVLDFTYWLGDAGDRLHALASLLAQAQQLLPDIVQDARDQELRCTDISQLLGIHPATAVRRYRQPHK